MALAYASRQNHLVLGRVSERKANGMTNQIAIGLGVTLIGLIALDLMLFGTEHLVFLGKKLFDLIEWMAFWR